MAMRTASPWWLTVVHVVGLLFVFLGERAFANMDSLPTILTAIGAVGVIAALVLRLLVFLRSRGERRQVEWTFLLSQLGAIFALLLYVATTDWGRGLLGQGDLEGEALHRYETALTVLWSIVMLVSLVPQLLAEISLGASQRGELHLAGDRSSDSDAAVDAQRVKAMAMSGLSAALAASFLMVTCNIAEQRNVRRDLSYFKTSSPGSATIKMVKSMTEPLTVLLFYPEVNEVKEELRGYFEALNAAAGNVTIEEHDHIVSASLAKKYKVTKEGTLVLVRGDKSEIETINPDMKRARTSTLRTLDSTVQKMIMKVLRAKRIAYFTVGHGELNDPKSAGPQVTQDPRHKATVVKKLLEILNYTVKDLGLNQGLANEVPQDATLLVVLAPHHSLSPDEMQSIDRYLVSGGSLMWVLDPDREADLGILRGRLGVSFNRTMIADAKLPPRVRRRIYTNQFSAHASVTTLNQARANQPLVFVTAGSLEDFPMMDPADTGGTKPKRTYVVQSMKTAFIDSNMNNEFDKDSEKQARLNMVAAIENRAAKSEKGGNGMRAMVFSDADVFMDYVQAQIPLAQHLVMNAVKWLGGEEEFAGETISEKDVRINHTQDEDTVLFYATIVGAPVLILLAGLIIIALRRRRSSGRAS